MGIKRKIRDLVWRVLFRLVAKRDASAKVAKDFPSFGGRNYFYDTLEFGGRKYFTKYFAEKVVHPMRVNFHNFKAEIVPGELVPGNTEYSMEVSRPSALPVCLTQEGYNHGKFEGNVTIHHGDETHVLRKLVKDRYYYLKLEHPGQTTLKSTSDLIVGDPIAFKQEKDTRFKLVLNIFVDSLTWEVLNDSSLEKELPNIFRFFSKGTIFDNCYTWGIWTMPSAPCIVTGRSIKNHGIFHPSRNDPLKSSYKIMSEFFSDAGYLTFQSCGNWRKTPPYGYVRGFDRTVVKREMGIEETLYPLLDHLAAFPDRNHFAWISLNDAHHTLRQVPDISIQTHLDLADQDYGSGSADQYQADPKKIARYTRELKKIDYHLGMLFAYVTENYEDDEFLVSLVSDHGVQYLTGEGITLAQGETHTSMMLRGGGVPNGRSQDLVQNIDLLPSMLHFSEIDIPADLDGRVPRDFGGGEPRQTVISEDVYPGQEYVAAVKDLAFDLRFTTKKLTTDDGQASLDEYEVQLYKDGDYSRDVRGDFPEVVERLVKEVFLARGETPEK